MSTPHDYYPIHDPHNNHPHLHNKGESRPYLDKDWHANDHSGPMLPALSTIGRGPRGVGLKVDNVVEEDGVMTFDLVSDLTGETVWSSPNLDPGEIEFEATDFRDLAAGQAAPLDIIYKKGGVTKTTHAYLPAGNPGSMIYMAPNRITRNQSETYQVTVGDLIGYSSLPYPQLRKPAPRVNDAVAFSWEKNGTVGLGFGTIESVGTTSEQEITETSPVVFTARVFMP